MTSKAICTATVTAHTRSNVTYKELITFAVTVPKFLLAQLNTHRGFSRNTESSRAIPTDVLIQRVMDAPVEPPEWFIGKGGMSPTTERLDGLAARTAAILWEDHRNHAIATARTLRDLGVAKEWANRPLDLHVMVRVLITTGRDALENFLTLRSHGTAQDYMQQLAAAMREAVNNSTPLCLDAGGWHVPFQRDVLDHYQITHQELLQQVARAARISYGKDFSEPLSGAQAADLVYKKLARDPEHIHASPMEHCAMVVYPHSPSLNRNLPNGFAQYRALLERGLDLFCCAKESLALLSRDDLTIGWELDRTLLEPRMVALNKASEDVTEEEFSAYINDYSEYYK